MTAKENERMQEEQNRMSEAEQALISIFVGIPSILLIAFLIYWFGIRDTWEKDNSYIISSKSESVMELIKQQDDIAAEKEYAELMDMIGDRKIRNKLIIQKIDSVKQDIVSVHSRIEKEKRDAEALRVAQEQRLNAIAEAEAKREQELQSLVSPQKSRIDWSVVGTARRAWQNGNYKSASISEQIVAMNAIISGVENSISDPVMREATLDHIQRNIDSW